MTKKEVQEIKKIINKAHHYQTYYQAETGELRIKVYEYGSCGKEYDSFEEKIAILTLLNKISDNGKHPEYRLDYKTYQGFIHITYIVIR